MARRAEIAPIADTADRLPQWLRAMEEDFSAFSGLPEPFMAEAREPGNPLPLSFGTLIATTDEHVKAAQRTGRARPSAMGFDLFLSARSVAWLMGAGATDEEALGRLRDLIESGYRRPGHTRLFDRPTLVPVPPASRHTEMSQESEPTLHQPA